MLDFAGHTICWFLLDKKCWTFGGFCWVYAGICWKIVLGSCREWTKSQNGLVKVKDQCWIWCQDHAGIYRTPSKWMPGLAGEIFGGIMWGIKQILTCLDIMLEFAGLWTRKWPRIACICWICLSDPANESWNLMGTYFGIMLGINQIPTCLDLARICWDLCQDHIRILLEFAVLTRCQRIFGPPRTFGPPWQ